MISQTSNAALGTTTATSKSAADQQKLSGDLDTFLKLLVTQLRNQDPLDPMDTNQFTTQLVQFSGVEQQIQQNSNLEKLIAAQQNATYASLASYLGQTIEADGNNVALQEGRAEIGYTLAGESAKTTITVRDATGAIVRTASGETTSGSHSFTWDGTDANGALLPDGAYTIDVAASDRDGAAVTTTQRVYGRVTSTSIENGSVDLMLGTVPISLDKVRGIAARDPATTTTPVEDIVQTVVSDG